jgi:hypothetical protein
MPSRYRSSRAALLSIPSSVSDNSANNKQRLRHTRHSIYLFSCYEILELTPVRDIRCTGQLSRQDLSTDTCPRHPFYWPARPQPFPCSAQDRPWYTNVYKFAPAVTFPPVASYGHQVRIMDLLPIRTSLAILLTLIRIGLFFDPYWHARPTTPRISSGTLVFMHQVEKFHWSSFGSGFATHNLYHAHTWIIIFYTQSPAL